MSLSPALAQPATGRVPERRMSPRRSVMDRRLITVNLDNRDAGLMVDIGEAGMAVQALAHIKQGASTALEFELPETAIRIAATGTVAWVDANSGRAGIRFETFADASAASLKEWIGGKAAPEHHPGEPKPDLHPAPPQPAKIGPAPGLPRMPEQRPSKPPPEVQSAEAKPASAGTPNRPAAGSPGRAAASASAAPSAARRLATESRVAEITALHREVTSRGLDRDAAFGLMAERARSLIRADGVAILLGAAARMTCRASSGYAPPVGADLQPGSGLSGECVRTAVTVRCEDTERDPRVDREACKALNIRSAVVVPLFAEGGISGLIEAFYAVARGFDGRDVLTLRRMGDLISATFLAPSWEAKPPAKAVASKPALPPATPPGPMVPPAPRTASPPEQVVCAVCGYRNPPAADACEKCHVPFPATGSGAPVLGSTLLNAQTGESRPQINRRLNTRLLILIILLLLLAGLWGWQVYTASQAHTTSPAHTTSASEPRSNLPEHL